MNITYKAYSPTNRVRFGSHYILDEGITSEHCKKLERVLSSIDNPRIGGLYSFVLFDKPMLMSTITSKLDENDCVIEQLLKFVGINYKEKIPSLEYFTQVFKDKKFTDTDPREMAAEYLNQVEATNNILMSRDYSIIND